MKKGELCFRSLELLGEVATVPSALPRQRRSTLDQAMQGGQNIDEASSTN